MSPKKLAPFALFLAALPLSGCVQRLMDFTVISTKNVEIPGVRGEKVEGEDTKSIVIIIPTGQPSIKAAVDNALDKGHGDVLLDAVISMENWYIPYIYGQSSFIVEGTSLKTSPPGTQPERRAPDRAPAVPASKEIAAAPEAAEPAAPEAAEPAASAVPEAGAPSSADASAPAAEDPAAHVARVTTAEAAVELLP